MLCCHYWQIKILVRIGEVRRKGSYRWFTKITGTDREWYTDNELIISLETGSWALNYTWCKFGLYQLSSLQLGTDVTDTWHEINFYGQAKTAYHNKLSSLHNGTAAIQHSESNKNEGKRLVLLLRTGISAVSFFYFNSTTASVCRSKLGVLSTFGVINDYVHSLTHSLTQTPLTPFC